MRLRYINPWLFYFVFAFVAGFLLYYNFQIPKIIFGKKGLTEGQIVQIYLGHGHRGNGYVQRIKYTYCVENKFYLKTFTVDKKHGWQYIGNKVRIEYKHSNPEKLNILGFKMIYDSNMENSFNSPKENGFYQLKFINSICYYTDFGEYGKINEEFIGNYKYSSDTLIITPFFLNTNDSFSQNTKYLVKSDSLGIKEFINIYNNRKFQ